MKRFMVLTLFLLFPIVANCADTADVIYHGGDIVTVDDKNPTAEAKERSSRSGRRLMC